MKIGNMDTPKTRKEFEYRMNLFSEAVRNGKFHICINNSGLEDSILRVRCMPNGRLDLLSVDEMVRLQANMMSSFNIPDIEELKNLDQNKNND